MEMKENSDDLKILKEMYNDNKETQNVELSKFSIDNNSNFVSFNYYFEDISKFLKLFAQTILKPAKLFK